MSPGSKLHPKDRSKPTYMLEMGEPAYRLTVAPNRITKTGQDQAKIYYLETREPVTLVDWPGAEAVQSVGKTCVS